MHFDLVLATPCINSDSCTRSGAKTSIYTKKLENKWYFGKNSSFVPSFIFWISPQYCGLFRGKVLIFWETCWHLPTPVRLTLNFYVTIVETSTVPADNSSMVRYQFIFRLQGERFLQSLLFSNIWWNVSTIIYANYVNIDKILEILTVIDWNNRNSKSVHCNNVCRGVDLGPTKMHPSGMSKMAILASHASQEVLRRCWTTSFPFKSNNNVF